MRRSSAGASPTEEDFDTLLAPVAFRFTHRHRLRRTTSCQLLVFLRAFYAASLLSSVVEALAAAKRVVRDWQPWGVTRQW